MYVKTIRPYPWDMEKKAYFKCYDQIGIPEYTLNIEEARLFETKEDAAKNGGRGGKIEKYSNKEGVQHG